MALEVKTRKTLVEIAREARWLQREFGMTRRQAIHTAKYQRYTQIYPRRYWS